MVGLCPAGRPEKVSMPVHSPRVSLSGQRTKEIIPLAGREVPASDNIQTPIFSDWFHRELPSVPPLPTVHPMHTTEVRALPNRQPAMRCEVLYFHNPPAQIQSSSAALHFWIRSEFLSELKMNRSLQAQIKAQFSSLIPANFVSLRKDPDSREWNSPRKG
jgi:hypothetical protein